ASSRVKLNQLFYRHKLVPPANVVETASFLATLCFMRDIPAVGFVADTVARQFEKEGLSVLPLPVRIELPAVGIITLRGRRQTPSTEQMIDCLRGSGGALRRQRKASSSPRR
ncbi:MAG: LysR family transcriptional regulator, partial [Proteobacteria bacterium]|nr:LysR family transcriptional regulator [Pseudomonadota bacterium]